MSNGTFALLWAKTLQSSIWLESPATRIVWITLLMLKDKNGIVSGGSIPGLAHAANVTVGECAQALEKFMAPDPHSSTADNDGRRIEKVADGWRLLNHEKYQYSSEQKRLWWKEQKREQRRRQLEKMPKDGRPLKGEAEAVRKLANGEISEDQFGEMATRV